MGAVNQKSAAKTDEQGTNLDQLSLIINELCPFEKLAHQEHVDTPSSLYVVLDPSGTTRQQ